MGTLFVEHVHEESKDSDAGSAGNSEGVSTGASKCVARQGIWLRLTVSAQKLAWVAVEGIPGVATDGDPGVGTVDNPRVAREDNPGVGTDDNPGVPIASNPEQSFEGIVVEENTCDC